MRRLGVSLVFSIGCLAAVELAARENEVERVHLPAATTPRPSVAQQPPVVPSGSTSAPTHPSALAGVLDPEPARVTRALRELAELVRAAPFDDARFASAVRALAHSLRSSDALRQALSRPCSPEELVSAAELLRVQSEASLTPPPLVPASVLCELRRLSRDDAGPAGDAASRALAALGTANDGQTMLAELLDESGARQERAARAFVFTRHPRLAGDLAGALESVTDPRTLELAVLCLARVSGGQGGVERSRVEDELARLASRTGLLPSLRRRILQACSELGSTPPDDPARACGPVGFAPLAADDRERQGLDLARQHEAALLGPATHEEGVVAAEAIARAPSRHDAAIRALAIETLRNSLAADASSAARRRALYALGAIAAPESARDLVLVARFDPDPSVRSSGLRALRRFDPVLREETLRLAASVDPSVAVRSFAAHELAWRE